ncbi:MAG TPA: tetratricopeptide repeat protein [Rudaea sp.]|nr:tetratricopeptide repeat protein [Rudaea sp.]
MRAPPPAIVAAVQHCSALLQSGHFAAARTELERVVLAAPYFAEAHRLLAGALQALGDFGGAERELRAAVAADPNWAPAWASLGESLANAGAPGEAEPALRRALALRPGHARATLVLARLLNEAGKAEDVLELTRHAANAAHPDFDLLTQRACALAALDRHEEALALYRRIAEALPASAPAALNLAAALNSAGRADEALVSARAAIAKGARNAEAHYVLARALIDTHRFDEADAALREAIRLKPAFADAHDNLAQLVWMRTGDADAASEALDAALAHFPDDAALVTIKATLLDGAGKPEAAHSLLAGPSARPRAQLGLLLAAARTALKFDAALARGHAARAFALAPSHAPTYRMYLDTLLATGAAQQASELAETLLGRTPDDQALLATQATAWRMLGDARYAALCDYAQMARGQRIDTPPGWQDLDAYLEDLATSLHRLHTLRTHPLHQSLRHGSQTAQNLMRIDDPPIRAFFTAIDGPIRRHIAALGAGSDPLRRRATGRYRTKGIWSVRLNANGYHTNHVHPEGWLSSAFYVALPKSVLATRAGDERRDGWLKFGEPGFPTAPPLPPEHYIRPEPGLLALFPSYFWHGTVPFAGDEPRLSIAFDVVPA